MKKILLSVSVIALAGIALAGGSLALFSDSETSTGNTFSAGAIDLTVDNESYTTDLNGNLVYSPETSWQRDNLTNQLFFNFGDIKPGDRGEDTISLNVTNDPSYMCMDFGITATPENSYGSAESQDDPTSDPNSGELQNVLNFVFWADDGDNVYEDGENIIAQGPASELFTDNQWTPLADSKVNVWGDDPGTPVTPDETHHIAKYWCVGTIGLDPVEPGDSNSPLQATGFTCDGAPVDNASQSDGISVDVGFYAVQSRHNEQFDCTDAPQVPEPMNPPST